MVYQATSLRGLFYTSTINSYASIFLYLFSSYDFIYVQIILHRVIDNRALMIKDIIFIITCYVFYLFIPSSSIYKYAIYIYIYIYILSFSAYLFFFEILIPLLYSLSFKSVDFIVLVYFFYFNMIL